MTTPDPKKTLYPLFNKSFRSDIEDGKEDLACTDDAIEDGFLTDSDTTEPAKTFDDNPWVTSMKIGQEKIIKAYPGDAIFENPPYTSETPDDYGANDNIEYNTHTEDPLHGYRSQYQEHLMNKQQKEEMKGNDNPHVGKGDPGFNKPGTFRKEAVERTKKLDKKYRGPLENQKIGDVLSSMKLGQEIIAIADTKLENLFKQAYIDSRAFHKKRGDSGVHISSIKNNIQSSDFTSEGAVIKALMKLKKKINIKFIRKGSPYYMTLPNGEEFDFIYIKDWENL